MDTGRLLAGLWSRLGFCLRVLLDLVSDLAFHLLHWARASPGHRLAPVTSQLLLRSAVSLARDIRCVQCRA